MNPPSNRRPSRRRCGLPRARFRVAFFAALIVLSLLLDHHLAVALAIAGVLVGLASLLVARRCDRRLAHSFVVVDWLLFSCMVAVSGGSRSWLLLLAPLLTLGLLGLSPRSEWLYLLAPTLLLPFILIVADPALAGHALLTFIMLVSLVGGGAVAAQRLTSGRQRPARSRGAFRSRQALTQHLETRLRLAAARDEELEIVVVKLVAGRRRRLSRRARSAFKQHLNARWLRSELATLPVYQLSGTEFAVVPRPGVADADRIAGLFAGTAETIADADISVGTAHSRPRQGAGELLSEARAAALPSTADLAVAAAR